jgi:hypothetical protein
MSISTEVMPMYFISLNSIHDRYFAIDFEQIYMDGSFLCPCKLHWPMDEDWGGMEVSNHRQTRHAEQVYLRLKGPNLKASGGGRACMGPF